MIFLSWREEYLVGIAQIDAEHQYLFKLINDFHDEHARGGKSQDVLHVLNRLVAYAEEHFQHEEALMRSIDYPGLARQQALHEKLFSSIFTLNEKLSLSSATVDSETLRFLKDWLVEHIVKDDTAIGDFMKRQAVQRDKDTPLPS
ncbi:MAG: bacteriohemerythrin [Burkholderiales bacterium]|jgi:hemerythrin|nr:bacteriohemerythrin [Burkholderiales bacterium]